MTTSEYLASLGFTMEQARGFIFGHLSDPALIYNLANQYDVTNAMLGEIVGGVTVDQVRDFFNSRGFDAAALDPPTMPPVYYEVLPGDLAGLVGVSGSGQELAAG